MTSPTSRRIGGHCSTIENGVHDRGDVTLSEDARRRAHRPYPGDTIGPQIPVAKPRGSLYNAFTVRAAN